MGAVTNYGGTVTLNDASSIRGNVTGYGLVNEWGTRDLTDRERGQRQLGGCGERVGHAHPER